MSTAFLEVIIQTKELSISGIQTRDEIEDVLNEVLSERGIGEVTGGGSGLGKVNIDIDIMDHSLVPTAVELIKNTLQQLNAPHNTIIKQRLPSEVIYHVYD